MGEYSEKGAKTAEAEVAQLKAQIERHVAAADCSWDLTTLIGQWAVETVALQRQVDQLKAELGETNEALAACQAQAGGRISELEKALRAARCQLSVSAFYADDPTQPIDLRIHARGGAAALAILDATLAAQGAEYPQASDPNYCLVCYHHECVCERSEKPKPEQKTLIERWSEVLDRLAEPKPECSDECKGCPSCWPLPNLPKPEPKP